MYCLGGQQLAAVVQLLQPCRVGPQHNDSKSFKVKPHRTDHFSFFVMLAVKIVHPWGALFHPWAHKG
jgi:hypothetical protein